jgi:hypothetical protein
VRHAADQVANIAGFACTFNRRRCYFCHDCRTGFRVETRQRRSIRFRRFGALQLLDYCRQPMIERSTLMTLGFATTASSWTILMGLLVGLIVFFTEGIQKLIFSAILGAGRSAHIGILHPSLMAPFVGVFETLCGALVVIGLLTCLDLSADRRCRRLVDRCHDPATACIARKIGAIRSANAPSL